MGVKCIKTPKYDFPMSYKPFFLKMFLKGSLYLTSHIVPMSTFSPTHTVTIFAVLCIKAVGLNVQSFSIRAQTPLLRPLRWGNMRNNCA